MKKLLTVAFLALTSVAFGATTTPVSLLNPSGSTSGQAIISNGPSAAPSWQTLSLSTLTGIVPVTNGGTGSATASGARTNLGLGTAAVANTGTSGAAVPFLNGANTWSAGQVFSVRPTFNGNTPWDSGNLASPASTSGTLGQFAGTTSSQLAGVISDETGAGSLVFATTPTLNAPNIIGVTTGSVAAAGSVGETFEPSASGVALTSGSTTNITTQALAAGDYDVTGLCSLTPTSTTIGTVYCSVNTTSATLGVVGNYTVLTTNTTSQLAMPAPTIRVSLSSAGTVYLITNAGFSGGSVAAAGKLHIRRLR